tara:strand:- start:3611 stop:4612 length:1002 start_codon:yes stop_codon:yes gene_type:complete
MCGIFGFAKSNGRQSDNQLEILKRMLTNLADNSSVRGEDSTGFSIMDSNGRYTFKTLTDSSTLVGQNVWSRDILSKVNRRTTIVMGHVRLATQGAVEVNNAHPFNIGSVTGVHNGIIHNYNQVARNLGKSVPEVDSQVLFQSLNKLEMNKAFEDIDGDFAITWVKDSNRKLHMARESGRPIVMAYWKKARVLLWASTKDIMEDAMYRTGLRLPIKSVAEDYILTFNTDKFDTKTNHETTPFTTISQYSYRNYHNNAWYNRDYIGGFYNPSPATKGLLGSGSENESKEMCSYCYEWTSTDEVWTDGYNRNVCYDCEFLSNEKEVKDNEEGSCPF